MKVTLKIKGAKGESITSFWCETVQHGMKKAFERAQKDVRMGQPLNLTITIQEN